VARSDSSARMMDRRDECRALDDLLAGARSGRSAAVVLRGEAGIGKTALLQYLLERSTGCRTVKAVGVQSEMELSYAGLHQLCASLLTGLDHLPEPQREALATAFGLRSGIVPDRFLVGLATLSLLANAGGDQPLVCLVDDAQWLDHASAVTLGFVARRLLAESVLIVFAVREPTPAGVFAGLPELRVKGLPEGDSRALLESVVTGPLDERVRDRIVAEARGNPLALLELPRGATAAEMAGGLGHSAARPLASQIEREYLRRVESLPVETRRLLLTAAAEPLGDVSLLRRAAQRLGIDADAAASQADASELITLGAGVRFRHPLVRSAVYRAAPLTDRREAHRALAESIHPDLDPDRRAWHRALAAAGPDEDVATELERSAQRAQARGGIAAVAAFLERAAELTQDPARRSRRAVEAAQAKFQAGAFESAADLLATAEGGQPDELTRARMDALHAGIAFAQGRGNETPSLLLAAARRLEQIDVTLARETYLDAVSGVIFNGHLASNPGWREMGRVALAAPPPAQLPRVADMLLDALAVRLTDGYAAWVPIADRAVQAFCDGATSGQEALARGQDRLVPELRWLWLASTSASDLWDHERWYLLARRHVMIARKAGNLSELPFALNSCVVVHLFAGELAAAEAMVEEARMVSEATGIKLTPYGALGLAALRGREREARTLIDATQREAAARGEGIGVTMTHSWNAVLCNGLGRYEEALAAAREAARHQQELTIPRWALAELVEAATRSGAPELASDALDQLSETTRASGTDWALGVEARSRALVSEGVAAESLYREAIERLSRTRVRMALARAHLLYGEWLRREHRRLDAREQLRTAHEMLTAMGVEAFAERARRELLATGETVHKRPVETYDNLTPQEAQIARLAGNGRTNPEIGAELFLSPRTVEWHLRKVFSKLGIASRREIATMLAHDAANSA
jgi:DNA-binding CsgD family transcriptional regulator/tetratricopeptide (TPR) repeat protein